MHDSFFRFAWLLFLMRRTTCKGTRDYVYAVFGLAERFLGLKLTSWIRVDYTTDISDLYLSFTTAILLCSQCLDLLALANRSEGLECSDLPSWVIDHRSSMDALPFILTRNPDDRPFNARAYSPGDSRILAIHGNVLITQGLKFDSIEKIQELNSIKTPKHPNSLRSWNLGHR